MLTSLTLTNILLLIGAIIVSIGIHEAMHAYTAHALGDDTAHDEGRLTLNPFAHIDPLTTVALPAVLILAGLPPILAAKPVPFRPDLVRGGEWGAALVGLAGPFTNLVLAAIGAAVFQLFSLDGVFYNAVVIFIQVNVGMFIFNMLPIPPLDGSRLLYAVAPEPVQRVMASVEQYGVFIILGLFIVASPVLGPILRDLNNAVLNFLL